MLLLILSVCGILPINQSINQSGIYLFLGSIQAFRPTPRKPEQQQINDLLEEICDEVNLDAQASGQQGQYLGKFLAMQQCLYLWNSVFVFSQMYNALQC